MRKIMGARHERLQKFMIDDYSGISDLGMDGRLNCNFEVRVKCRTLSILILVLGSDPQIP
jgi:hypothetical protein